MNIGDIVGLVKTVEGVATKVPAIVTKVYENVHNEVVADLHELETTITGVVSKEENPTEAVPEEGVHVTTDLAPTKPADTTTAAEPDAALTEEESAYANLSPEDQAAFADFLAAKKDGSPST